MELLSFPPRPSSLSFPPFFSTLSSDTAGREYCSQCSSNSLYLGRDPFLSQPEVRYLRRVPQRLCRDASPHRENHPLRSFSLNVSLLILYSPIKRSNCKKCYALFFTLKERPPFSDVLSKGPPYTKFLEENTQGLPPLQESSYLSTVGCLSLPSPSRTPLFSSTLI